MIGFKFEQEIVLQALTQDVLKSSEIEGEILDGVSARSSIARHLGMDIGAASPVDRSVDGVVEMILDATLNFDHKITKNDYLIGMGHYFRLGEAVFLKSM